MQNEGKPGGDGHWQGEAPAGGNPGLPDDFDSKPEWEPGSGGKGGGEDYSGKPGADDYSGKPGADDYSGKPGADDYSGKPGADDYPDKG